MTWLLCGLSALVMLLSALLAAERLRRQEERTGRVIERDRRIAAERERDGFRRVAVDVVGRVGEFVGAEPPLESVR